MDEKAIVGLKDQVRGEVILPGNERYDGARKVYNGMIDKHPRLIALCTDVADVISAVKFAKEQKQLVAIRGGGHSGPGFGVCDDGLVIDLSKMRGVRVDPENRTVRVEGGCTWGDVDHATHAFGLAVPSGVISTTGVAGLTLGGGHGYLTRRYGLTIDNLLEADMVLADGSFVTASNDKNKDLFWAIRGGSGNFGVVTSFLFRAHPVSMVYGGPMAWHLDKAADVMKWYREFIVNAPEDVSVWLGIVTVPPAPPFPEQEYGKTVCILVWCCTGPLDEAEETLRPIRKALSPLADFVGPMPYPALQSMFDPLLPPGLQWYWKGDFVKELSDDAIKVHMKYASELPTPLSIAHFYPINGAVHRVGRNDTPFSYRDVTWSLVISGVDPDPANNERMTKWAKSYWEELRPFSAGGAYVNFMMEEGRSKVEATYRDNYKRLVQIKSKYDPTNLFRVNQNIPPA
jgi:hypothetical protein